ncbi:MAG: 2-hydroxyglutaryl-CoA dehydratase [Deltaproteobacteria bacterium]|nr:MAG: 2-hydroxyglutaryl-CoA dehydratase [Deltaproteobacteria bacterium]
MASYFMGIDVGSLSCDAVIVGEDGDMVAWAVVPTGARNTESIALVRRLVLERAGIEDRDVEAVVSTGYGRERVEGRLAAVTEITCHGRGINHLRPGVKLLIDIGGQDSKVISLDGKGRVLDFAMNDKCAAGTGRFLEAMARALETEVHRLGELDPKDDDPLTLSSVCTVFAESEVVSLIAEGTAVPRIVGGLHRAIAARIRALARRVADDFSSLDVAMSGGVARNSGVVNALERALGCTIFVPAEPDIVGALGAALICRERASASGAN